MWFWLSLIALLCWSGSDLFSKIGCRDARDKYSHLKMVMAVGVVMGLHAAYEVFVGGTVINLDIILTYLPVSILYIRLYGAWAMWACGTLSCPSPPLSATPPARWWRCCAILFDGIAGYSPLALVAVALVCVGAVGLGVVEAREDDGTAHRAAEGKQLQVHQELHGPGHGLRLTACWTLPAPLPTAGCWRSSAAPWRTTRPAPTWPMS